MHATPKTPVAFAVLALLLASPAAALDHAGSQTGTWALADSPHVVTADVQVPAGLSLTIEPGCLVMVAPDASFEVQGTLVANGTPQQPISIVSQELRPNPGDWAGLDIAASGAAWLSSVRVGHAMTGIRVADGGSLDAQDLQVTDSLEDGIVLEPLALGSLVSSTMDRNGASGLRVEGGAPLVANCTMRLNDVAMRSAANAFPTIVDSSASWNRSLDGILVDASQPITDIGTWRAGGLPWVVADGETLRIETGARLGLDGDAVLQFGQGARFQVAGELSANGNAAGDLVFTSLLDDEAAGDTNRDGSASAPGKGDWSGLDVEAGGTVSLTRAELRNGDDGIRVFTGGSVVLLDTEIHSMSGRGLALGVATNAVVQDSMFHDTDTGIEVMDTNGVAIGLVPGNDPTGGNNSFHCNLSFDIDNGSGFVLQAQRNYWGTAPPDPSRFAGAVDTGSYLILAPPAALERGCMFLSREAANDLRFDWSEMSSCARYQLSMATAPNGVFGAFTNVTVDETHLEPGAAAAEGTPVRYYRMTSDFEGQIGNN